MGLIQKELFSNADKMNLDIHLLEYSKTNYLIEKVKEKFTSKTRSNFLWEDMIDSSYFTDSSGWSYVSDFIKNKSCIIFFFESNTWFAMNMKSGYDLVSILGESFGFEFYVTDQNLTYLICFNHHDQLIGAGLASQWVSELYN